MALPSLGDPSREASLQRRNGSKKQRAKSRRFPPPLRSKGGTPMAVAGHFQGKRGGRPRGPQWASRFCVSGRAHPRTIRQGQVAGTEQASAPLTPSLRLYGGRAKSSRRRRSAVRAGEVWWGRVLAGQRSPDWVRPWRNERNVRASDCGRSKRVGAQPPASLLPHLHTLRLLRLLPPPGSRLFRHGHSSPSSPPPFLFR